VNVRQLTQDYLHLAANETDKKGNKRAATTMTSYRRALEGFAAAVEQSGLPLTELPESFIERNWLATQQSVIRQPIQLRVRVGAIKQFTQWLFRSSIACAPMRYPAIQTPPPKPKEPKEMPIHDVTSLGDAMMEADPVPSTHTQPVFTLPEPPPAAPAQRAAAPQPPPPRQQKAPVGPGRPSNPLASILPSGQYKMRVRREREADDPVWLGDYPAERVAAAGAVEPFLQREVVPKLLAQGITGDVTFLVCALSPDGREGDRARITVAVVPQAPVQTVSAPVAGAPAPVAPQTAGMQPNEMADMLSYHRRAQEELEERIAKRLEAQQTQQQAVKDAARPVVTEAPRNSGEMDDLKKLVGQLAGTVQNLAARLEERDMDRMERLEATPAPQPAAPQLDILSVIREVTNMTKAQQPPPMPMQQPMGLGEVFSVMAQAKQMFQPAQVNVDVSPLEEQLADLRHQLTSQAKKKDEIVEMVEKFKAMRELFGVVGGEMGASKPTNGLSSALGNLVNRVIENPAPLADAVERILTATAQVKAAQNGTPPPPRAAQPVQQQLPPQLGQAGVAMLDAESDEATVVAAHEWLTMVLQVPPLRKAGERITGLIKAGKTTELAIYLRQVLTHLGAGEKATADRCKEVAAAIMAQVQAANTENEEEEEDAQGGPDLTVRVGGVRAAASDEDEEEEYDEDEDEDEEEDESDEDEDESQAESDEELEAAAMADAQENHIDPDAPSREELEEVLSGEEAEVKPRRKRRTKAEMEAARATDAAVTTENVTVTETPAVSVVDTPVEVLA
jgi:hypothetical protein